LQYGILIASGKDGRKFILIDKETTNQNQIFEYGKHYLRSIDEEGQVLTANACTFCPIGKVSHELEEIILKTGFSIIQIENCNLKI
jgi:hypothetical protein